jgi:hypothetical protein
MHANELLDKARKLREVSRDLNQMADRDEPLSEALSLLSGTVCRSAIMIEVLVAVKLGPPQDANRQLKN